jgi:DeoR/GlpR family transcriptional regulator of sugar metabolism
MRALENQPQKRLIGRLAATLIEPGETVILDAGSTIMEMARQLSADVPVTVVTTALNIAAQAGALPNAKVIIAGGSLSRETISTVGSIAERDLGDLLVDKAFISAQAIHPVAGLTDVSLEIARVKAAMIRSARKVILLADGSKWGRTMFAKVAALKEVDVLVTDAGLPAAAKPALKKANVELHIAKAG